MICYENNKKSILLSAALLIGMIILQGCSTVPARSDFLDSHLELMPAKKGSRMLWWEKPGFNWQDYNKLMVDPLIFRLNGTSSSNPFTPEELDTLAGEIRTAFTKTLAPEIEVVNEPGAHVLRIRAAATDIAASSPALNLLTTAAVFVPLDMGGASIEVEFMDSVTNERLAAMAERKTGTPLQLLSGFSRFGHAKKAFDQWSEALKSALVHNQ